MKRKIVLALLCSMMLTPVVTGCNAQNSQSKESTQVVFSKEDKKVFKEVLKDLQEQDKYLVQTVIEAPDGNASYLEVVNNGSSYTEMPVDDNGQLTDTVITDENSTGNYAMTDWVESDGTAYMSFINEDGSMGYYSLPQSYGKKLLERNTGYFEKMVDSFTSVKKEKEKVTGDIGDGEEEYTMYLCSLPAEVVREMLGISTYGLYETYAEDKDVDANVKKLCQFYLEDLDSSLTFSDARVSVAVSDGKLRQLVVETGGLGTKMYVTKTFLMKGEFELREKPDFSKAKDFADSMKEVADYVEDCDTYDEAMKLMEELRTSQGSYNTEDGTENDEAKSEDSEEKTDESETESDDAVESD